jgi:formylglycine-generating enzyme required for sulfatase activity
MAKCTMSFALQLLASILACCSFEKSGLGQDALTIRDTPTNQATSETITNSIGMKLIPIAAGRFTMGSPASERGSQEDELLHKVELTRSFHMGKTEVTEHQWAMVMEEPFRTEMVEVRDPDTKRLIKKEERQVKNPKLDSQLPITDISWSQAVEFCKRLGQLPEEKKEGRHYRLPTEAEWEYACRAGTSTAYSFGDDPSTLDSYAWHKGNSNKLMPVALKKPNAWRLFDMHGNAAEWCFDYYGDYAESLVLDPLGANSSQNLTYAVRSGSIKSRVIEVRSSSREKSLEKGPLIGFRLVLTSDGDTHAYTTNSIGQHLVKIHKGSFEMGSDAGSSERPVHTVELTKDFLISSTEVTQGQWTLVMGTEPWKEYNVARGEDYAACGISWFDAQDFCRRLSSQKDEQDNGRVYRLPTEAEWEFACRAGSKSDFFFGDLKDLEKIQIFAWFRDSNMQIPGPHRVSQKDPNSWGLYDMHGNVAEWCSDFYGSYSGGGFRNPSGPPEGEYRVFRGGSWNNLASNSRSADRYRALPHERNDRQGFRVVVEQ